MPAGQLVNVNATYDDVLDRLTLSGTSDPPVPFPETLTCI
jgi:hypothetical protein